MKRLLTMCLFGVCFMSLPVLAQSSDSTHSKLRVSPVLNTIQADPSDTVRFNMALENPDNKPKNVTVTVNDFTAINDEGLPVVEPNPTYSLSNWFTLANTSSTITIPANKTISFPAEFAVPRAALARSYFGVIRFAEGIEVSDSLLFINVGSPTSVASVTALEYVESVNFGSQFGELKVSVVNNSDGTFDPKNIAVTLTDSEGNVTESFTTIEDNPFPVLPKSGRDILIPLPSKLTPGEYTALVTVTDSQSFNSQITIPGMKEVSTINEVGAPQDQNSSTLQIVAIGVVTLLVIGFLRKYQRRKAQEHDKP